MNGSVHTAAAKQRRVGGVHYRLRPLLGNVTGNNSDAVGN